MEQKEEPNKVEQPKKVESKKESAPKIEEVKTPAVAGSRTETRVRPSIFPYLRN